MDLLEIETVDDAVAFLTERREVSAQSLQMLFQMFGPDVAAQLNALIAERGIEIVGDGAY